MLSTSACIKSDRLLALLVTGLFLFRVTLAFATDSKPNFDWDGLEVLPTLRYSQCYKGLECARLEVPLDWNNASNLNKVGLAIIRVPAKVHQTHPSFGGTILLNPGGPGGSGVDFIQWMGTELQEVMDSDKHFEVLSWDPRGVHHTTPSPACFADDEQRETWMLKVWEAGSLDTSDYSFDHRWAAYDGFGKLCAQTHQGVYPDGSNVRQYVSTALTARDMVEIIDQVEAHRNLGLHIEGHTQQKVTDNKPALLNYYGLSYGTHLGNTFASMFPERIGRMILDGNVDSDDYMQGTWLHNLQDNNHTLEFFFKYCFDAGSECALYRPMDKKPADLASKVFGLLDQLKHSPLSVVHNGTVGIVLWQDLAWLMHTSLYAPNWSWPRLARILSNLLDGNTTSIIPYLKGMKGPQDSRGCNSILPTLGSVMNESFPEPSSYPFEEEAERTIICGDAEDLTHMTKAEMKAHTVKLIAQSAVVGPIWADVTFACIHWPGSLRPAKSNRFAGPFRTKLSQYDPRSSPLLFIGNTADPVTPLRNAFKNALQHEGSRVLIQNSPGHGTGYLVQSTCTTGHIKSFFARGILPAVGTQCELDATPWGLRTGA